MLGQAHHFRRYAPEKLQYAIDRYTNEATRIYNVIDKRLAEAPVPRRRLLDRRHRDLSVAGAAQMQGQNLDDFPNLKRWYEAIRNRPATQRGFGVMADVVERMRQQAQERQQPHDQESWNNLFGSKQFEKR